MASHGPEALKNWKALCKYRHASEETKAETLLYNRSWLQAKKVDGQDSSTECKWIRTFFQTAGPDKYAHGQERATGNVSRQMKNYLANSLADFGN